MASGLNTIINTNYPASLSRMEFYATDQNGNIVRYDSRSAVPSGYTHILTGDFGVSGGADIFCYDAASGQGDIWARTENGGLVWESTNTSLPTGCTLAIDAKLTNSDRPDLLLYNPQTGTVHVYSVDPPGRISLAQTITGMRTTWTHVVRGNYNGNTYQALFFYDAAAGHGEFWISDGTGKLTKSTEYADLRQGCSIVVQADVAWGRLPGVRQEDVVLYDAVEGVAVMCVVDNCTILDQLTISWRPGFSKILAVNCFGGRWDDFLCYDPTKGEVTLYRATGGPKAEQFNPAGSMTGLPDNWTAMSSTGAFKGGPASHTGPHFVSYNQTVETWEVVPEPEPTPEEPTPEENVMSQSRLEFYATNSQGEIVRYDVRNDVHPGYTHILTSPFGSGWTNIFAYDAALGQADIWKRTDQGETILVSSTTSLRKGATLVVEARLTGTKLDVVLYDAPKGELDIYQVDQGQVTLAKTITGMKTSWTHVVRGNYDGGNYDCLFFYDAAIGRGEFWMTDGQGNLTQGNYVQGAMPRNGTSIVRANLSGAIDQNDVLTYNSSNGMAAILEVQSPGGKGVRERSLQWVPGFTQIMPVACSSTPWSDLLAYNQAKGELSIYTTAGSGGLDHFSTLSGVPKDWTSISGIGTFLGGPSTHTSTHFVAYNRTVGADLPTPPVPVPEPEPTPQPEPTPPPATVDSQSRFDFYDVKVLGEIARFDTKTNVHPSYTNVITGSFGSGGVDIFAYDAPLGRGDFWTRNDQGETLLLHSNTALCKGAKLVAAARVTQAGVPDFLFYDAAEGAIHIYKMDNGTGKLTLLKTISGMRKTWTHMVPGNFNGDPYDALYFYDADAGWGEFYMTDGAGNLTEGSNVQSALPKGCNSVVRANLRGDPDQNDILFVKSTSDVVEMMEVASPGCRPVRIESVEWRNGITQVVPIAFSGSTWTDLLAYDQQKGELSVYTNQSDGTIKQWGSLPQVPRDWTSISSAGKFKSSPYYGRTTFVCYNRTVDSSTSTTITPPEPVQPPVDEIKMTGKLALYTMDDWGMLGFQVKHEKLRAWTHVLSGSFSRGSYNKILNPDGDLFFYDFYRGEAETVKVGADGKLTTIGKFKGLMKKAEPIVFDFMGSMGGIMLYSPAGGIEIYDASLGKMTLVKTFPAWNKEWTSVVRGGFSPNAGNNDFVFHTWRNNGYREHWTLNKQGTDLKKVYEASSLDTIWHSMVSGRFVGNTFDDYVSYNYDTGQCYLFRGGANELWWAEAIAGSTQPARMWSFLCPVMLRSNKGFSDSILAYSYSKQRAETMEVQSDGRLVTVKHLDNVGKWSSAAQMPNNSITRRIAFFTPLEW